MSKLTILRGLSGSGKSTWAESQPNAVVVSRDRLRVALFGSDGPDYYQQANLREREDYITKVEHVAVLDGLKAGQHVISDNTNIEMRYVKVLAKLAYSAGAEVEVKVFDVPVKEAVRRNAQRALYGGRNVPEATIQKQHQRFQSTKGYSLPDVPALPEPYEGTPGRPEAFMVDIDGTLAHMAGRGPFDWKRVGEDAFDESVGLVSMSVAYNDVQMIVMSGRDESCREETVDWLIKHGVVFDELFMRPEKDMRPDNIVKAELFDKHVRDNYDVQFVIDDRWQVCEMWLQMGLKVFNVSGLDRGEF